MSGKKTKELAYDATKTTGRRRQPSSVIAAEHMVLPPSDRRKLLATAQDQLRNASIAAWMVRRHLDYVSRFRVEVDTGNDRLNTLVERIFNWHARPDRFDISGRFGREEMFRMFELEKVVSGDAALIKLSSGHLQAIESDLIAVPTRGAYDPSTGHHKALPAEIVTGRVDKTTGVIMDPTRPGRVASYCICNRLPQGTSLTFDHFEPAENVIFDGYYTRLGSQIRGVSPLSSALNAIQDVYEGVDYNLAKAKVHAIFGIALMRDYAGTGAATDTFPEDVFEEETGGDPEKESADVMAAVEGIAPNEMLMIDMDTRGRIDTIESKTPSTEFREFTEFALRLCLAALDIPYSAFDSTKGTFSSILADNNMYEVACRSKREKNLWKRQEYSDWLLSRAWNDPEWGLQEIANQSGITRLRELQETVRWVASGFPWLQKIQEVEGDIRAISIGLDNPIDAARRRGGDVFENIDKTARVYEYAHERGVPIMIGMPGQATIDDAIGDKDDKGPGADGETNEDD